MSYKSAVNMVIEGDKQDVGSMLAFLERNCFVYEMKLRKSRGKNRYKLTLRLSHEGDSPNDPEFYLGQSYKHFKEQWT